MSLPSSIWVKFTNEDAVLVTYLGVQYRMTVNEAEGWYEIVLTGSTATTGTVLVVNTGAPDMSGTATNDIALYDVEDMTYTLSSTVGTLTYDNWSVTSFTGSDISAASIVHRDVRLPLFVELLYLFSEAGSETFGIEGLTTTTFMLLLLGILFSLGNQVE